MKIFLAKPLLIHGLKRPTKIFFDFSKYNSLIDLNFPVPKSRQMYSGSTVRLVSDFGADYSAIIHLSANLLYLDTLQTPH